MIIIIVCLLGASNEEKLKLIRDSTAWHSKLVKEAATG